MRLLFDQNLSPKLVELLRDVFPGSSHLALEGLDRAPDAEIFEYARERGYTIVTKDADFHELSRKPGAAPKVIWLGLGNCATRRIEELMRERLEEITVMDDAPKARILRLLP
ncbi:MAG: DUF5615 family PIN-like protein [Actinomycetota bacterium]|jgi:predicted nuclease of predicted toxin-antitoxin system|nr:DUF5615 family PIN-like protein [Rubrobacter sp.]MDQ3509542.1 DUF5615 family PIN-like protein [Actinomycetota bacterium]